MIRPALCLALLTASAAGAEEPAASALRDRLRALAAPSVVAPSPDEVYADEIAADLERIGARDTALFGPAARTLGPGPAPAAIALFVGPDCADCMAAESELAAVLSELGLRANVLDVSDPATGALMAEMTLDTVPSYVMPDRLIRGQMPGFVLRRYLEDAR